MELGSWRLRGLLRTAGIEGTVDVLSICEAFVGKTYKPLTGFNPEPEVSHVILVIFPHIARVTRA